MTQDVSWARKDISFFKHIAMSETIVAQSTLLGELEIIKIGDEYIYMVP